MTNSLVGSRLGKYEIQAEIGKGGMGMVYQGYDALLDRRVAVKVLAPHLVWEPGFIERFLREARSAARLKHASIVTIYDVGQQENWYYIVMEYLEGQTLAHIIRRQGALPLKQVLAFLRRLADALDYAHQSGLVHRDVKPGNIVVDSAGHVTLTDFGVARAAQETRLTTTGALVGTPQYMSPEQARGEEVGHCSDIYSLGVVAYEMLSGRAPFGATTPHAVLHQLIYDPPPSIRSRRPDLSADVDRVLTKALAKEPIARYETARGFVDALGQALTAHMVPASPASPVPSGAEGSGVEGTAVRRGQAEGRPGPAQVRQQAKAMPVPRPAPPPRPRAASPPAVDRRARTAPPRLAALWLGWLLVSVVGWAVGWALGRPLGEAVSWPIGREMGIFAAEMAGGATAWAVLGLVLGLGQWLVLRRTIRSAGWWVLASVVGWAVVGAVKWSQGPLFDEILFGVIGLFDEIGLWRLGPLIGIGIGVVLDGLSGLVVGVAQYLVLQHQVRRAGRWVLINVLAWASGAAVIGLLGWALGNLGDEEMFWLASMLGGIVPGVMIATGLVRLLSQDRKDPTWQR
jgi:hypothetical protein